VSFPVAEEDTEEAGSVAGALEREIISLERELESIAEEENALTREIESLAAREALGRRRLERALEERESVARQIREAEEREEELGAALDASRAAVRSALREIYKQSSMAGYTALLAISDPADIMRGLQHLDTLARRQREAVRTFTALQRESEATAAHLSARRAALDRALGQTARAEKTHAADRQRRQAFLRRLREDRTLHLEAVTELKRAASDLAAAIESLPPGSEPPPVSISFDRLRGALPWPADGRIAVAFGRVRHPRFATVTPHDGLDIDLEPGAPVRAVAAGRVVFSRRYGGYGRTVVIDHGARYLSVYARLAAAAVKEGAPVAPGQKIGFVAEGDEGGKSKLYFEIRHQGKALDPAPWLRRSRRGEEGSGREAP
jgi:septal ring factor EnvC (AmiA/AmiB activator)